MTEKLLEQMNEAQRKAAAHREGPLLVLAGPGSGKTLVITARTKYLVETCKVPPEHILVVTFTKAAAASMRERFCGLMGGERPPVTFGTFHAVFFQILKHAYGYTASAVAREEQKRQAALETAERMGLDIPDQAEFLKGVLGEISYVKNEGIRPEEYVSRACPGGSFPRFFREYGRRMRAQGLLDFDDMLVYCRELLMARKDILAAWQRRYRYILVDEFQDVNAMQYETVKLLAGSSANLFIVGDDDQSIYRFRGARPQLMRQFQKDYPQADTVLLNVNYRCGKEILHCASRLIACNKQRFSKEIEAFHSGGAPVRIHPFAGVAEENAFLLGDIRKKHEAGVPYREMAVLFRTNVQPRQLMEKLMAYNIPFRMKDGLPDMYSHFIARNLLAYIRLGMGERSRGLFLSVMNRPNRYISREAVEKPQVFFSDLLNYYSGRGWMEERIRTFEEDVSCLEGMSPYTAIHYIRRVIGYEDYLREYARERGMEEEELLDVLAELQEASRPYASYEEWFAHMKEYQEEWKRQMEEQAKEREAVQLMTMHSSKGLEYQTVYLTEANEGLNPYKRSVTDEEIEEERRLFYVAMTRAKEELHICWVRERCGRPAQPSRFLRELSEPEEPKASRGAARGKGARKPGGRREACAGNPEICGREGRAEALRHAEGKGVQKP